MVAGSWGFMGVHGSPWRYYTNCAKYTIARRSTLVVSGSLAQDLEVYTFFLQVFPSFCCPLLPGHHDGRSFPPPDLPLCHSYVQACQSWPETSETVNQNKSLLSIVCVDTVSQYCVSGLNSYIPFNTQLPFWCDSFEHFLRWSVLALLSCAYEDRCHWLS